MKKKRKKRAMRVEQDYRRWTQVCRPDLSAPRKQENIKGGKEGGFKGFGIWQKPFGTKKWQN